MKNARQEKLRQRMRKYHQHHSWCLGAGGIYSANHTQIHQPLSWWNDMGFVLNGRRVMVWWTHPRTQYAEAIQDAARTEAGTPPVSTSYLDGTESIWKPVGRSRKKVAVYRCQAAPQEQQIFYNELNRIRQRLETDGIDLDIRPSITVKSYETCFGIDLCIPFEILTHADAIALISLVKSLLKRETTLAKVFPNYHYDRETWLAEANLREHNKDNSDH